MKTYYFKHEEGQPVNRQRLWLAAGGPIALWALHFIVSYVLIDLACSWGFFPFTLWGLAGIRIILLAVTLVAAVGLLWGGIACYRFWRYLSRDEQGRQRDPTGQFVFWSSAGGITAGYLLISMVWYVAIILLSNLCVVV